MSNSCDCASRRSIRYGGSSAGTRDLSVRTALAASFVFAIFIVVGRVEAEYLRRMVERAHHPDYLKGSMDDYVHDAAPSVNGATP